MKLQYDFTPRIHYIITSENITLKYGKLKKISARNTYDRLFNFINYDLNEFTQDLNHLYTTDPSNSQTFIAYYHKIKKHIDDIFGLSHPDIINYFLCNDYCDYWSQNYSQYTPDYVNFVRAIYMIDVPESASYIVPNILLYAFNLYNQKKGQEVSLTGSANELYADSTPPCKLNTLQNKFKNYCKLYHSSNERYRLRQKTRANQIEYQQLVCSALEIEQFNCTLPSSQDRKKYSFSEKIALDIYTSRKNEIKITGKSTISDQEIKKPEPRKDNKLYRQLSPIYENNIQLDFSHGLINPDEISYFFNNIESILILDMFLFLKTTNYICRCSQCEKIFHKPHLAFYCQDSCKDKHHYQIKTSSDVWCKYETLRKRISARIKAKTYDMKHYKKYMNPLTTILDNYSDGIITKENALKELKDAEIKIDSDYKQIKEDLLFG